MKTILLICMLAFVNGLVKHNLSRRSRLLRHNPPPPPISDERKLAANITEEYFTQKLDHYDPTNTARFSQRYFTNDAYFDTVERNVAFLMIGGESDASESWMNYGPWVASAKKYKAILFQLEHRFYGKSQPFDDLSVKNLRYLSSQQALADLATFIVAINEKYELSPDVKWILFGGSYSGSLAAWAREKYPHLIKGAMSASGPLLAKLDFSEYMQVVADDLAISSQECADTVRIAINQVESLLRSPSNEVLNNLFHLCDPIEEYLDDDLNIASFFDLITLAFPAVAQYNNIPGTTINVDDLCEVLTNKTIGTEVDRLAAVNELYFGVEEDDCLDYDYNETIEYLQDITIFPYGNERQWIYQTCTEFGWYQTTNQEVPIFGTRGTVDFYTRYCTEAYAEIFNDTYIFEQTERTNMDYGALNIETSNIVYVHGTVDPWHAVGLTKTTNPESPVILINGTAHCANFYEETPNDVPGLIAAREEVDRLIGVWLGIDSN